MSSSLRILRIVTRLNVGGPTRHIAMLCRGMPASGHVHRLLFGPCDSREGEGILTVPAETDRRFVPDLTRGISPVRDARAYAQPRREIRPFRPHVVHTHQSKAGFLGRAAAFAERVPCVVHTFHGHVLQGYWPLPVNWVLRAIERRSAKKSTWLVVQAEAQAAELARLLGDRVAPKLRLILPALDPGFLTGAAPADRARIPASLGIPGEAPTLVMAARLVPIKRPQKAIRLLAALPGFHLILLGDGPLRSRVLTLAGELGVLERLHIVALQSDPRPYYDAADLAILTSAQEGTPLCFLEARARGLPIAATDVGAVRDVAGPHALLWSSEGRPEDWADALGAAWDRRNARIDPLDLWAHSPERLVGDLLELYRSGPSR